MNPVFYTSAAGLGTPNSLAVSGGAAAAAGTAGTAATGSGAAITSVTNPTGATNTGVGWCVRDTTTNFGGMCYYQPQAQTFDSTLNKNS